MVTFDDPIKEAALKEALARFHRVEQAAGWLRMKETLLSRYLQKLPQDVFDEYVRATEELLSDDDETAGTNDYEQQKLD